MNGFAGYTTNGGANWSQQVTGTSSGLYSIQFINNSTGWAAGGGQMGGNGTIIKSTNSGTNWQTQLTGSPNRFNSMHFANLLTGWCAGDNGTIYATVNGGANWSPQVSGTTNRLTSVYFTNSSTGWITSINGMILITSNGGANWSIQASGLGVLNSVKFADPNTGWCSGSGGVMFKTTNSGINWYQQYVPVVLNYNSVFPLSATDVWAVGDYETIIYTSDGGTLVGSVTNGVNLPGEFSLSQNYPNPFNPETNIKYLITKSGFVSIKIFDILGEEIAVIVNEQKVPGTYEVNWNAKEYPSGIYFYRIESGDFAETKKMVLIK
jgi:photosystem II stability/assembly factor-like uncharacterized protein